MLYEDIKKLLYRGRRKIANNTYLKLVEEGQQDDESVQMLLHNNLVAEFYRDHFELYSAGWYTKTTKDRLNLALSLVGVTGSEIYQHNRRWYYGYSFALDSIVRHPSEFFDGISIDYDGYLLN